MRWDNYCFINNYYANVNGYKVTHVYNAGLFFNFLKYQSKKQNSMYIFENEKFKKHLYKILKKGKNVNF